jgi:hypothetical protein
MLNVILCSVCGVFESLADPGVSLEQYTATDGALTVLSCRPCASRIEEVYARSNMAYAAGIRALRIAMIEQSDDPVTAAVEAMREVYGSEQPEERRTILTVIDGGLTTTSDRRPP